VKVVRATPARAGAAGEDVRDAVRAILDELREGGDAALVGLVARHDGLEVPTAGDLVVPPAEVAGAVAALDPALREALELAMDNVEALVRAQLRDPVTVRLAQGQRIEVAEVPVAAAGIYAPGGRGAYPSTVVMCAVTARTAGVERLVVCSPPGEDGRVHPVVLAACALCGVDEVLRIGGAQAVGAMAYGAGPLLPVDLVAGPGNRWVTEAKRQVAGDVGIDGLAGPSELVIVASEGADPELVALDLLAQAEHGPDGFLALLATGEGLMDEVLAAVERLAADRPSVHDATLQAAVSGAPDAVRLSDQLAPEHLELVGAEAEALAGEVRSAGCLYVGAQAATAFGDYVAGTNHVLPTGGAARFQSALSAATFRRRMARVTFPGESAARLAPAGAAIARAEGFPVHAESMERRA
jgi:histidinol dehydrogenase